MGRESLMVGGKRKHRRKREYLGSHQKAWLYGRHVVLETLRAGRWIPHEVWIADDIEPQYGEEARLLCGRLDIEPHLTTGAVMSRRCGSLAHQGLMARMPPFPYSPLEELLAERSATTFLVILDSLQDPFNFGAIVRSAEVFGACGVIVGTNDQSEVTVQAARSSVGAVNHVPIAQVPNLIESVRLLKERGIRVVAASEKAQHSISSIDLKQPCAIVLGNEGTGIQDSLVSACDEVATIPQSGCVGSLNAAVAAGVLLYEVQRQRST